MSEKTNAVAFGDYAILLEREQLSYYIQGELFRVKDVNHEYNSKDLFAHAQSLAEKKGITEVKYITKSDIKKIY